MPTRAALAQAAWIASTREVAPPPSASVRSGAREDHRVALDVLDHLPGEAQRAQLLLGGLARGHHRQGGDVLARDVRLLHQHAAEDAAPLGLAAVDSLGVHAQQPALLLAAQPLERVGREVRREQHLGEDLVHRARQRQIERPVRDDDAPERRVGVGREGELPGLERRSRLPDAAGRIVLQDRDRGALLGREVEDQRERRLHVDQVVVGELLAVQGLRDLEEAAVERGALVRVLAVAQQLAALEIDAQARRQGLGLRARGPGEVGGMAAS